MKFNLILIGVLALCIVGCSGPTRSQVYMSNPATAKNQQLLDAQLDGIKSLEDQISAMHNESYSSGWNQNQWDAYHKLEAQLQQRYDERKRLIASLANNGGGIIDTGPTSPPSLADGSTPTSGVNGTTNIDGTPK
jgi:hypothetical protein